MYELLKVVVQPVILERDASGKVTGEQSAAPVSLYSADQVSELFASIEAEVAKHNAATETLHAVADAIAE